MNAINRILYVIYVLSLITAMVFFILVVISGIYRLATGTVMMFLYGWRFTVLGWAIAGTLLSALLSNQVDKLLLKKKD